MTWVFLSHTAVPGGAELALARMVEQTSLPDVRLWTFEDGPVWDPVRAAGVPIDVISGGLGTAGRVRALRRAVASLDGVVVANSMRAALILAAVAPRRARAAKLVYWVRDGLSQSYMSALKLASTRWITLRRIDAALANSRWTADTVHALAPGLPVQVAPSPAGVVSSRVLGRTPRVLPARGPVRLLFLGRIAEWKGVHVALAAAGMLADSDGAQRFTLTIAGGTLFGEDDYLERILADVARTPNVEYLGHVSGVDDLIAEHDVLLHCSITPEPFGQVLVQGMAHGLAVFATAGGGPSEIVTDGVDGVLCRPDDAAFLANSIASVTSSPDRYTAMSAAALTRSEDFVDAAVVATIDKSLRDLVG